ncbi:hypothetical protein MMC31_000505 [Peltigera leucophlebia]|nr:hypothetical protein [Peltigera leucophlebia]
MEHAHPLPDGVDITTRPPSWPSHSTTTIASITACTPPRLDEPLNQQTKLLQLRNASFRGALLPGRRISPIFGSPPNVTDAFLRPLNDENSPKASERRLLYGEDLPPNPVNILQEIHNTARQRRASPKPGFGAIFHDKTATGKATGEIGSPRAEEQHSNWSPSIPKFLPKTSKLNHGSENDRTTSPPSSPSCSRPIQGRRTSRVNPRSTSLEATKYIEHLESQLTAANAKIESYASPAANKARSSKVRALSIESRILRQEVFDWEKNFAERVKDELDQHLALEAGIRSRLQMLEDELEIKDVKMRELEWELDTMRARVKDAEGLLEINLNLEKRIDVLTSLLVISPTKLDLGSAPSSPCKMKGHRSRSMLPKGPLSPGGIRLSLNTGVEGLFPDPKRVDSNSDISYSPAEMSQPIREDERENLPEETTGTSSSSRASASSDSIPTFSSRPTSIQSASSAELTCPEGLSGLVESQTTSAIRQRKMRRFPSGTCTLKPLILPKAAIIPSIPASAPLYTFSESPFDDLSDKSVDPLTAFLSQSELSSSLSTPDMALRRRRATWTQNQTLKALEGKLKQADGSLEASVMYDYSPISEKISHTPERTSSQRTKRPRPLSLEKELELANGNSPNQFDDGLILVESEGNRADQGSHEYAPHSPSAFLRRQRSWTADSEITPKQNARNSCMEFLHHPLTPNHTPVTTPLPPKSAFDILTRLANLISRAKQDPVVLAQRILYNAWTLGCARFGGVGWWLLGLGFRSSQRQARRCAANSAAVEENPSSKFNWQHFSAHASRQRAADSYIRNHQVDGGQYADAPHELTSAQEWQISRPECGPSQLIAAADSEEPPQTFPCDDCEESTSRRTFRLWIHLSLAIVLAVGVAIKEGPGVLFTDTGVPAQPNRPDNDDGDDNDNNNEKASF